METKRRFLLLQRQRQVRRRALRHESRTNDSGGTPCLPPASKNQTDAYALQQVAKSQLRHSFKRSFDFGTILDCECYGIQPRTVVAIQDDDGKMLRVLSQSHGGICNVKSTESITPVGGINQGQRNRHDQTSRCSLTCTFGSVPL